jgi:hypothetical protein
MFSYHLLQLRNAAMLCICSKRFFSLSSISISFALSFFHSLSLSPSLSPSHSLSYYFLFSKVQ